MKHQKCSEERKGRGIMGRCLYLLFISASLVAGFQPIHWSWRRPQVQSTARCSQQIECSEEDRALLDEVDKDQLTSLCESMNIDSEGSKEELLLRLRAHADEEAQEEAKRQKARMQRIRDGSTDNSKERYEIIGDPLEEEDEGDLDGFFYFELPDSANVTSSSVSGKVDEDDNPVSSSKTDVPHTVTPGQITAPPIPDNIQVNDKGERVATIYNSADQNDLTGIAAAQPGRTSVDSLAASADQTTPQPWDYEPSGSAAASSSELDKAKQSVTELVQLLLIMTGAPAYAAYVDDLEDKYQEIIYPDKFVGFRPADVPADWLVDKSVVLRAGRGQVLQDVLRQFELHAVGQDGMAGDEQDKGGGHYRQVTQIRAFLEGYRRAEVRRVSRETTVLLLDKLVQEGVQGLDMTLAAMTRTSDDTGENAELNDSLLQYLDDTVRQQEQRVEQMVESKLNKQWSESKALEQFDELDSDQQINSLWNVEDEDGEKVETIDPSDPNVRAVLEQEQLNAERSIRDPYSSEIPSSGPEKLLLLLKLLRERIKAEATFAPDEKGRNLRLLAYCLRLGTEPERESLLVRDLGGSLDRIDSFVELVSSSIEYGESTSHQLQSANTKPLNVKSLRDILNTAENLRRKQGIKASGVGVDLK